MAQGKQTPRQKMINLMYLVFIAMLALNMSKEVLNAFGMMNKKLTEANAATTARNSAFMASLSEKVTEQPAEYKPLMQKAQKVNQLSDELTNYLAGIKKEATAKLDDPTDYAAMDRSDFFDQKFFASGKLTPEGEEFVGHINDYREGMLAVLGNNYPKIAASIKADFSTAPIKLEDKKITKKWYAYHYEGFPLIASLTKLSQMQADVKTNQSAILSTMLQGQLVSAVSMSNYEAMVIPSKTAFYSGENFTGKVVLGRVDKTMNFGKVIINGQEVSAENVQAGQVILDFPAGNVGSQTIKGELQFQEGDSTVVIPIEKSYSVIPKPNAAVISADKMNVVYRGVQNPMTISVPGAGDVTANAPGLRKVSGAGQYMMNVTNVKAREVKINVTANLPGGEKFSDSKVFRIEEIPRPSGTVRGQMMQGGAIAMQRGSLAISTVSAKLPNFAFDLNLNVSGFSIKVEGERTIVVNGQQLNQAAKRVLQGAQRGSTVTIFDIKASIAGNSDYRLPPVSPIIIQLKD
ncbi:MAG TPA: gliding motility protein GldM [Flavobacteriaceae bacterium]|nr:gliding motility protein GldM [Flavobacteriaceae bacterium]